MARDRIGAITRAARRHRAALLAGDARASRELALLYQRLLDELLVLLADVTGRIAARRQAGQPVTPGWLYQEERYRALLREAERLFNQYGRAVGLILTRAQQEAVRLAAQHARELIDLGLGPPPPGIPAQLGFRLPHEALIQLSGQLSAGSPLLPILDSFGPQAAATIREELLRGVGLGLSPLEVSRRIRQRLAVTQARARTIARTEMLRAYREAARETYRANRHLVTAWIWHATLSPTTCAACWAMHGREFALDTPMGTHPNCRCSLIPKTKTWAELGRALGFDAEGIPETSARSRQRPFPTGPALFARLDPAAQDRILGSHAAGEAYRAGEVELRDFVRVQRSADWGTTRSAASLKQARRTAERRGSESRS